MLAQAASQHRLPWPEVVRRAGALSRLENDTVAHCAMLEYARFHGEWDPRRRQWKWQGLPAARHRGRRRAPRPGRLPDDPRRGARHGRIRRLIFHAWERP
ncbi:hypothetical protein [Azotobacter chroococcum]|uniref:hypothetical protein n=1 Tax=Azotobacter chroococcum TaxID=353 RepID=UPI000AE61103|nr:hypothetical protein [Azotobacter chroococcum]